MRTGNAAPTWLGRSRPALVWSGCAASEQPGRRVRRGRVLQARDDRAACLAGHGRCRRGRHVARPPRRVGAGVLCRSRGVTRRPRLAGAGVLCRSGGVTRRWRLAGAGVLRRSGGVARPRRLAGAGVLRRYGWCGRLLHSGASAGGHARGSWPRVVGPIGWPRWADECVRRQRTAARAACVPMTSPWRDGVRHAGDRRIGGHVDQARPGARVRRGVPKSLAVPRVSLGADRAGPRVRQVPGARRRCGAGSACQVGRACWVRQRRGPGGAAWVGGGRLICRCLVLARRWPVDGLTRVRRAWLAKGQASARQPGFGRCRVTSRRRWSHRQARRHGYGISDRSRVL